MKINDGHFPLKVILLRCRTTLGGETRPIDPLKRQQQRPGAQLFFAFFHNTRRHHHATPWHPTTLIVYQRLNVVDDDSQARKRTQSRCDRARMEKKRKKSRRDQARVDLGTARPTHLPEGMHTRPYAIITHVFRNKNKSRWAERYAT